MRLLEEQDLRWVAGGHCSHGNYSHAENDLQEEIFDTAQAVAEYWEYKQAQTFVDWDELPANTPEKAAAYILYQNASSEFLTAQAREDAEGIKYYDQRMQECTTPPPSEVHCPNIEEDDHDIRHWPWFDWAEVLING